MYEPGTEVVISYTGYHINATVVKRTRDGEVGHNSWVAVRQDSGSEPGDLNDFTDRPEDERPEFLAAEEFISLPGEPVKPSPLYRMAQGLGYDL